MEQISDLLMLIFQHCVMPWMLPLLILSLVVFMSGGRSATVFGRAIFIVLSLTRMFLRMILDAVSYVTYRKITRRYPPKDRHLNG